MDDLKLVIDPNQDAIFGAWHLEGRAQIHILGAVSVEDFGLSISEFHALGAGMCAGRFHFDVLLCVASFLSMVLL